MAPTSKIKRAIFTADTADQLSLENSMFRHGFFFHYLLQGLKGEADRHGDS
jgi:G:T-mismatch repair DNA endonuclease (very short patch repair protein)